MRGQLWHAEQPDPGRPSATSARPGGGDSWLLGLFLYERGGRLRADEHGAEAGATAILRWRQHLDTFSSSRLVRPAQFAGSQPDTSPETVHASSDQLATARRGKEDDAAGPPDATAGGATARNKGEGLPRISVSQWISQRVLNWLGWRRANFSHHILARTKRPSSPLAGSGHSH